MRYCSSDNALQLATSVVVLQLKPPRQEGHARGHLPPLRSPALTHEISATQQLSTGCLSSVLNLTLERICRLAVHSTSGTAKQLKKNGVCGSQWLWAGTGTAMKSDMGNMALAPNWSDFTAC